MKPTIIQCFNFARAFFWRSGVEGGEKRGLAVQDTKMDVLQANHLIVINFRSYFAP